MHHRQLRCGEHARGPGPAEAARPSARDPQMSWATIRCSTWSARSSPPTCSTVCSASLYARRTDLPSRGGVASFARWTPAGSADITESALEGLAKRDLNLSTIVAKSIEAKERRLVPEVSRTVLHRGRAHSRRYAPKPTGRQGWPCVPHRPGYSRVLCFLLGVDRLETAFRQASVVTTPRSPSTRRTAQIRTPALEWVTPGHPLFEVVRQRRAGQAPRDHLRRGAVFYDLHRSDAQSAQRLYAASIRDGRGQTLAPPALRGRDRSGRLAVRYGHRQSCSTSPRPPSRTAVTGWRERCRVRPPARRAGVAARGHGCSRWLAETVPTSGTSSLPRCRPPRRDQPERPHRPPAAAACRLPQPPDRGPDGHRVSMA